MDNLEVYSDEMSGQINDRPGLIRMLNDIDTGRYNVVVVSKLDRLGRNAGNLSTLLTETFIKKKVIFISLQDLLLNGSDNSQLINGNKITKGWKMV